MNGSDQVMRVAEELYKQRPGWVTFFREVFGIHGIIHQTFTMPMDARAFETTADYVRLQEMLAELRAHDEPLAWHRGVREEPTRVITVRLPKSLHQALLAEAHDNRTSLNKLAITKLLQPYHLAVHHVPEAATAS